MVWTGRSRPKVISIPLPLLFDRPAPSDQGETLSRITSKAAAELQTLAVLPAAEVVRLGLSGKQIVLLVKPGEEDLLEQL